MTVSFELKNLIISDKASQQLIDLFCQCPAAADLLNRTASLYQTLTLQVGNYPKSFSEKSDLALNTESFSPKKAKALLQQSIDKQTYDIGIDRRLNLKICKFPNYSRLKTLAFELYNGAQKKAWNNRDIQGHQGNLPRDEFASIIEKMEWDTTIKTHKLMVKCQPIWNSTTDDSSVASNFEEHLFSQEITGHTDYMRRAWIECCQKAYCTKHPKDSENCEKGKEHFIDYYALQQMPEQERNEIFQSRVLQNLHKAPDSIRQGVLGLRPEVRGEFDTKKEL